ncbi:LOW QUALITY PROTEIN: hypothetical protein V2J09_022821 [Rumex salicifolius]
MLQSNPQRLRDELEMFGSLIKEHRDNMTFLKAQSKELHDSLVDLQVRLDKYQSSSRIEIEKNELSSARIDKETIVQIMQHGNSAAGILCEMQVYKSASLSLIEDDVIGIVANLGRVDDDNFSRLLSEYLGLDTMLAIVCKSYVGVKSLEAYDKEGCVREDSGMHLFGSNQGKTLKDRFQVICLENLRHIVFRFVAEDPQKRLDIPNPTNSNGEISAGFLGFAVNLIKVDVDHLYFLTANGCGIRETLFYSLFSRLQVYKTRLDMLNALPYTTDGAISLDGGMIRSNGAFFLGRRRFPKARADVPMEVYEIKKQTKQKEWEKKRLKEEMQREQSLLDQAKHSFQHTKQQHSKLLAERSSNMKQIIVHTGGQPEEDILSPEEAIPLALIEEMSGPSENTYYAGPPIDYSDDFKTDEVWMGREGAISWAREVARKKNMVLTIQRSQHGRVHLACERYGTYRCVKNGKDDKEGERRGSKRTKKSGCKFGLHVIAREVDGGRNEWRLQMECGVHNHPLPPSLDGHAFAGRLTHRDFSKVKDLVASGQVFRYVKGPSSMIEET